MLIFDRKQQNSVKQLSFNKKIINLKKEKKNLSAIQETQVQLLGWEDPLEKGIGNPLQYPCLENSMNRGTWWATVLGILKELDMTQRLESNMAFPLDANS